MKALAVVVLVAMSTVLTVARERRYGDPNDNVPPFLDFRSGAALEKMTMSYKALAADLYWIRAVQHFGGQHQPNESHAYALLYPLLDLTTTLDPRFNIAYRFGAIFLAEPYPAGAARPDLAIKLLEKGIAAQPNRWEYFHDIGFVYYLQYHDYKTSAEWYEKGSRVPGAPWWLAHMAAVTLARGGDRASSRFLWQRTLESADNDWIRQQAALRLAQLDAMDQIDLLQKMSDDYRTRTGRPPASFDVMQRVGLLRPGLVVDPSGEPYRLDPGSGRVSLSRDSKLYPLPTDAPGAPPGA